ncbi:hypothetical protein Misp02_52550 [Microtetraspora sp. NBRC 16547]|nr:hypothetical protein Misp02_52550 [Microtetraspora sp. NBRC 16547]
MIPARHDSGPEQLDPRPRAPVQGARYGGVVPEQDGEGRQLVLLCSVRVMVTVEGLPFRL